LATCYQIVKEHGGMIRVESSLGKGSVFKISLLVAN
jgi:signal transduction histidine kinase